jgi:predicted Zn-dependent peptidase
MKPKFYRKVLKNGLTVILEKRALPVVSVAFAVKQGGVNEDLSEKGISHFIEHLLYKGTPTRNSEQIALEIERRGGILNGFTSETSTAFWCKIPSKSLFSALDVLSDMVKNPLFDENEIEKEREVIFEEIRMCKDSPSRHVLDKIKENLFEKPFGESLAGTFESMKGLGREEILKLFQEVYVPENMVLCVVGNADFDKIVKFAEKEFSSRKRKVKTPKIKKRVLVSSEKRKGIDQANLVFGYHFSSENVKNIFAAKILSVLMASGMSSRLFKEIREKRNLAYAVAGDSEHGKGFGYSIIYVGTTPKNVPLIKKIILEEFQSVASSLEKKEFSEIVEQIVGNYFISSEDSQEQLIHLLSSEIDVGNAKAFYDFEKNIRKVNLEDVKKLALFASKNFSFYVLEPEN